MQVSSAYLSMVALLHHSVTRGLAYIENDKALSTGTEPCSFPLFEVIDLDMVLLETWFLCVLQVKKLATKLITFESRCFSSGRRCLTSME